MKRGTWDRHLECDCGKHCYRTKRKARIQRDRYRAQAKAGGQFGTKEMANTIYRCVLCGWWHLSRQLPHHLDPEWLAQWNGALHNAMTVQVNSRRSIRGRS